MSKRVFWFHYNKPMSKKQGRNVLTLHWKGQCHFIHSMNCYTPVRTENRKNQPKCVIKGKAQDIIFGISKGFVHADVY